MRDAGTMREDCEDQFIEALISPWYDIVLFLDWLPSRRGRSGRSRKRDWEHFHNDMDSLRNGSFRKRQMDLARHLWQLADVLLFCIQQRLGSSDPDASPDAHKAAAQATIENLTSDGNYQLTFPEVGPRYATRTVWLRSHSESPSREPLRTKNLTDDERQEVCGQMYETEDGQFWASGALLRKMEEHPELTRFRDD